MRTAELLMICTLGLAASGCAERIVVSDPVYPESSADAQTGLGQSTGESVSAIYSLPTTVVTVAGTYDTSTKIMTYSVTPAIVPDAQARFRLRYVPTHLSDDTVTLGVDQNGLLSTITANATGRQGDIVVALATTVASAVTLAGIPISPPPVGRVAKPAEQCSQESFSKAFALAELTGSGQKLPDCSTIHIDWRPTSASVSTEPPKCGYSVCYRPLMPVTAYIDGDQPNTPEKVVKFVAVDPDLVEGLNVDSAPLVTRTHTVTFTNGLLTSAQVDDPSVTLAVVNLPLTIVKAVLSAPGQLTSFQVNNSQTVPQTTQSSNAPPSGTSSVAGSGG